MRSVFDTWHDLLLRSVIRPKLVGDHHPWRTALPLQQLAHQTLGCLGVVAALHQNIENETVLIDGTPQPMLLPTDRNDGLVEMPFVAEPPR